jgi:hypothetical protein
MMKIPTHQIQAKDMYMFQPPKKQKQKDAILTPRIPVIAQHTI